MNFLEPALETRATSIKTAASRGGVSVGGDVSDSTFITSVLVPEALEKLRSAYQPPELPKSGYLPDRGALPPGSRLPFTQNAVFTGRKEDLLAIAESLRFSDIKEVGITQKVAIATGLGGVGKSQLAVEFCYRFGRFFHGVHWIQAPASQKRDEIDQCIDAEIAACGFAMQLPRWPDKLPDQVAFTLNVWGEGGRRLIVLDNIEDPDVVQNLLPQLNQVHLLLTSRRSNWPMHLGLKIWPLDVLPRIQSIELLCKLAPRLRGSPYKELDDMAERLGDLPLALDLAGRYMEECYDLSPIGYLKELDEASSALEHTSLQDWINDSPTKHATSLATTFALSWNRLTEERTDILSRQIFRACGYCSPNVPIPKQLLSEISGTSDRSIYRAVSRLSDLGLIVRTEKGPRLHPLLADFARRQDQDIEGSALSILAEALRKLAVEANSSYLPQKMDPLREHLWPVASFSEDIEPKIAGELWNELGDYLNKIAEFSDAKFANETARDIYEKVYDADHPKVAEALCSLGTTMQDLGDPQEAKINFERALKIEEKVYGLEHPRVAGTLHNLGMTLQDLGDLQGAKMNIERALKIEEKVYGPDHPNVAALLNNLGMTFQDIGDPQGAKINFERALKIEEKVYGPDHPSVAALLNNLGATLQNLGDPQGAKMNIERALKIEEKVYGPDHPIVARTLNNLGLTMQDLGDLQGAKMNFERALKIEEKVYGPDHPSVARTFNNLGTTLQYLGDLQGAKRNTERALEIYKKIYGPDHSNVAASLTNLGNILLELGDLQGAIMNYERALEIQEKVYGPEHPSVAKTLNNLGMTLQDLGDLQGAKRNTERALEIYKKIYGPNHLNVARTLTNIGAILCAQGNRRRGIRYLDRALLIYKNSLGNDHPTTKKAKCTIQFANTMRKGSRFSFDHYV